MRGRLRWVALSMVVACSAPRAEAPWRKPGDRIDSILPMAEYLRQFRAGLEEPTEFAGGAPNREALARRVLEAIARDDTTALGGLLITRAEFAWLVFPAHRYALAPYELDPALFWFQLRAASSRGLAHTLSRYGGKRLQFIGLSCEPDTLQFIPEGPVRGTACRIRFRADRKVLTRQLFGTVLERGGHHRLLSYTTPE